MESPCGELFTGVPVLYGLADELDGVSELAADELSTELSEKFSDEAAEEEPALEPVLVLELEYAPLICDEQDEPPFSDCVPDMGASEWLGEAEPVQPDRSAAAVKSDNNTKGFFFKYHLPLVQFHRRKIRYTRPCMAYTARSAPRQRSAGRVLCQTAL